MTAGTVRSATVRRVMKKNGRVTAWTEQPEGMPLHAVVRVDDELYVFKKFDRRRAKKLGDGVSSEIRRQEGYLKGRKTVADKRTARLDAREAKLAQREKLLKESMKRSHELTSAANWEAKLDRIRNCLRIRELEVEVRERNVLEQERDANAVEEAALATLTAAREIEAVATTALDNAEAAATAAAESKLKRAVARERAQAEESLQKGRAVLKHLEDKLAEVRKKEELLDRRLEAMTNLMCGNVRDALEGIT